MVPPHLGWFVGNAGRLTPATTDSLRIRYGSARVADGFTETRRVGLLPRRTTPPDGLVDRHGVAVAHPGVDDVVVEQVRAALSREAAHDRREAVATRTVLDHEVG
jgi:hypothetical protein